MLDAFKIKPFELEPVYASWTDCPRFIGNPKKDLPVDDWLKQIKAGCVQRDVPKEYWHKVAQHFMGDKAKARLEELKTVMAKVHGGTYRWNWEKYKIAMRNMGWSIDPSATEAIKVQSKSSGLWWIMRKKDETESVEADHVPRPVPTRSESLWATITNSKDDKGDKGDKDDSTRRPIPTKSNSTDSSFWLTRKNSKDGKDDSRPVPVPSKSDTRVLTARGTPKPPTPSRSNSGDTITTVTHAPIWLLNACNALDFLTTEHPKVMSTISAILITAGTLPAIPAISAGAGGAVLASGAAQAVGAIAVGVGSWLKAQQDGQVQPVQQAPASSKVR